jgi:DNA-binding CsgD family transcriptional regulator
MRGKTYKQIAEYLDISVSGVRRHLERVILQNALKSTIELISKY